MCYIPEEDWKRYEEEVEHERWLDYIVLAIITTAVLLFMLFMNATTCHAEVIMDMKAIRFIESSNITSAYNAKSGAIGSYQITPIVIKEWNNYNRGPQLTEKDLFNPITNEMVAKWYMNKRIPQMLRYYKVEDTWQNRIIAYNAGISYLIYKRDIPYETEKYIEKYRKRTAN